MTAANCQKCAGEKLKMLEESERRKKEAEGEIRYRRMVYYAGIPPKWNDISFDNSDTSIQSGAFGLSKSYAENFNRSSPSLIFYSRGPGTGKTHLAVCIANYILHVKRVPVVFTKARDLMLELKATFSDRENTEAGILKRMLSATLLILDDVGVDMSSRWQQSTYWTVFDSRLDSQLPIIITTNKPMEGHQGIETLEDIIGDRAFSRLIELTQGNVIDMSGRDLRWSK